MSRHIVACGGGGWSGDPGAGIVEEHILGLARSDDPRVLLVPTASGDSDWLVARFHERFAALACRPGHLPLFGAHPDRLEARLREQDVIYVGGGSSANLMAVWGVHGLGPMLRRAWEDGVVLAGVSAGAICWFERGLTNSLGPGYAPVDGLGFVPGGFCPHADSDPGRLVALRRLIDDGLMPPTLAVDDGAAVHIRDDGPPRLIRAEPGRAGRRIGAGGVEEVLAAAVPTG